MLSSGDISREKMNDPRRPAGIEFDKVEFNNDQDH
jgi:hypothetical protein